MSPCSIQPITFFIFPPNQPELSVKRPPSRHSPGWSKSSLLHNPPMSSPSPSPVGSSLLPLLRSGSYHCRLEWLPYHPPPHWLVKSTTTHHHKIHFCLHFHPSNSSLWMQPWYFFFPKSMSLRGLSPYIFQNTIQTPWFMTHGLWPSPACSFLFQYLPSTQHSLFHP